MGQQRGELVTLLMSVTDDAGNEKLVVKDANEVASAGVIQLHGEEVSGQVTKLVMAFTYPDGSGKIATYGRDWIDETEILILDETQMTDEKQQLFSPCSRLGAKQCYDSPS